jgi:hypothetical protein
MTEKIASWQPGRPESAGRSDGQLRGRLQLLRLLRRHMQRQLMQRMHHIQVPLIPTTTHMHLLQRTAPSSKQATPACQSRWALLSQHSQPMIDAPDDGCLAGIIMAPDTGPWARTQATPPAAPHARLARRLSQPHHIAAAAHAYTMS